MSVISYKVWFYMPWTGISQLHSMAELWLLCELFFSFVFLY